MQKRQKFYFIGLLLITLVLTLMAISFNLKKFDQ